MPDGGSYGTICRFNRWLLKKEGRLQAGIHFYLRDGATIACLSLMVVRSRGAVADGSGLGAPQNLLLNSNFPFPPKERIMMH